MPSAHDFVLTTDHETGRRVIASALEGQGFTVSQTPTGGFLARRGSTAMTVLLGGWAGDRFQVSFVVDFFVDGENRMVARLNRDMTSGALKGGAIGAAKVNSAFQETANALHAVLHGNAMLLASQPR
ncbi:hypothetical protein [Leifsonia sp. 22587]|uniref:hypothetical protein n=1 Tax=Leifsonia sp. 22587 TaxID=3453946 RepID=UPI003F8780E3